MSHSNNSSPPWRRILLTAAMLGTIVIAVGVASTLLLQNEGNRASLTELDQKLDALTQENRPATAGPEQSGHRLPDARTPSKIASQATMQTAADRPQGPDRP